MAEDQTPIWQVIEEFKEKIKVQEADLKKRRDELDLIEKKLRDEERAVANLKRESEARETAVSERERNVSERDEVVRRKESELMALETDLAAIERQLRSERSTLESRQAEIATREQELLHSLESSSAHEKKAQEAMTHLTEVEDKLLAEESNLKRALEEASARREELLAKAKVLEEQGVAVTNNKRLMIEQQKRFVDWERALNEREKALNEQQLFLDGHVQRRTMPVAEEEFTISNGTCRKEEETAAAMESAVEENPPLQSVPAPIETEPAEVVAHPVPEPAPGPTPVKSEEISCPRCSTIIESTAVTCWACGVDVQRELAAQREAQKIVAVPAQPEPEPVEPAPEVIREEPKPEPRAESEDHQSAEVKKSVSIRKIIKRK